MERRYSVEEKIQAVRAYLDGKESTYSLAKKMHLNVTSIRKWIIKYGAKESGTPDNKRKYYSMELKKQAISDYLSGIGSYEAIAKKYEITTPTTLEHWIKVYNGDGKIIASGAGGITIMNERRKTTFDERIKIAAYCIAHDYDYAKSAEKYNVSYQQARNYTIKYEKGGIEALQDRRGKRKDKNSLTEIERLKAELAFEKAKRQKAEMEVSFLKKLEEIERRRG